MDLRLNLNLTQAPRELNPELNRALLPIYNALKLIQEGFQLTETAVSGSENLVQELSSLLQDVASRDYATLADIPEVQQIFFSNLAPNSGEGKDKDLWFATSATGLTKIYAKFSASWALLGSLSPQAVDTSQYLSWKGTWALSGRYVANSVVMAADGAVYLALTTHVATALNAPPNPVTWKLLQEAVVAGGGGLGEAVLSSRAPSVDPAPPNFVISRLGDLVYARLV